MLINAAIGDDVSLPETVKDMYQADIDMTKLTTQLNNDGRYGEKQHNESKTCDKCRNTVCDILNSEPGAKTFMSAVALLLKLYLTIPVTTATTERSFSTLRRVKTCLRSTMTQCRLNNVMLLHCHKDITKIVNAFKVAAEFASRNIERKQFLVTLTKKCRKESNLCESKGLIVSPVNAFLLESNEHFQKRNV